MNLQEYFSNQKKISLSDQKKLDLLSYIKGKRQIKTLPIRRFSFSYKKVFYSFLILAIAVLWIGWTLLEKNISIDNMFFSINTRYWGVYAEHIAEIIEFNGEYTIQKDGLSFSSQFIYNEDTIHLKKDAEMTFNLNDDSQSKIIGPAIFSIIKNNDNSYKIILTKGYFFTIYNETSDKDIEIITDNTSLFSEKYQKVDLQLIKDDSTLLIKNNWGDIKVIAQKNERILEKIINQETISINTNSINTINNTDTFNKLLVKNNISETIQIQKSEPTSTTEAGIDIIIPDLIDILTTKLPTHSEQIDENIKSNMGINEKIKIPTKEQNNVLQNKLASLFLSITLDKIAISILEDDSHKKEESLIELRNRLNEINSTFGRNTFVEHSLSNIREQSLIIKQDLEQHYYISPSLLNQLEKLANRCEYLQTLTKNISSIDTPQQREQIKNNLPSSLQFK